MEQITLEKLQWLLFTGGAGSLLGGEMKLEGVEGSPERLAQEFKA